MKRIRMELSAHGIDKAISQLNSMKPVIDAIVKRVCQRLSEDGALWADLDFSAVAPSYVVDSSREIDYSVTAEPTSTGYVIRAVGADVLFLEFGAGIRHSGSHPLGSMFGYVPGSYPGVAHMLNGQSQGLHPGYWKTPSGQYSEGNQPSMGMYNAFQRIQQEAIWYLREEFHNAGY